MLRRFRYWEREQSGEEWQVEPLNFGKFNLIVGRNAAGKTRLLKSIARVAGELSGELKTTTRAVKSEIEVSPEAQRDWARSAQYLPFAAPMDLKRQSADAVERLSLPAAYQLGFKNHGSSFEQRILQQLDHLGYPMQQISVSEGPTLAIEAREKNRARETPFRRLSQAQQRSLSFITLYTLLALENADATLLVDDFAEGLDFESARKLTRLVWEDSNDSKLQLIISSNDRYVMNTVPLEHWTVLTEEGNTTRVFNYENSKQKFDEFKFTGLSNFDFFSMEFTRDAE